MNAFRKLVTKPRPELPGSITHWLSPVLVILSVLFPRIHSLDSLLCTTQPPVSSDFRLDWSIERPEVRRRESLGVFLPLLSPSQHCGSGNGCIPLQLQPRSRASIHNDRFHGVKIPLGLSTHSLVSRPMQSTASFYC